MSKEMGTRRGTVILVALFLLQAAITVVPSSAISHHGSVGDEVGGVDDLVWLVQLSDLHFSVHHPDRAHDFIDIVGPTLAFIKPSLVFLTGDLTDGKSLDMVTMKQDEREWIEYRTVMQNVVQRSGLDQSSFYDVRGNHDNFGVPIINGSLDFFSKYSISVQLQRNRKVNSITIKTSRRKLLFVGFDSTTSPGVRGPTNLLGHPNDELLAEIESELSQTELPAVPITKISFGHFPISFSAASESGRSLKDIFISQSLDAYLCGHLHIKFGKNLKRYHHSHPSLYSNKVFQLNGHRISSQNGSNCPDGETRTGGFWEWEMGDWRKSRAMRILAIDGGHISFVDVNFKFGAQNIIILPTFPLDSRFSSVSQNYKCVVSEPLSNKTIRALVFSTAPILSVFAKIYDSSSGSHVVVMEAPMTKLSSSRGNFFVAPFNIQAFEDPSPDRYLLEIVATDISGSSVASELRPFSVTGIPAKFSWSLKEFLMMGCQWDAMYYALFWLFYILVLPILLIPKLLASFSWRQYAYRRFNANESFISRTCRLSMELCNIPVAWFGMTIYVFYLILCPWFCGQAFTVGDERLYMVYRGWISGLNDLKKLQFIASPDIIVVVLPHIYLVVFPALVTMVGLAAESAAYRIYLVSVSSKKNDDHDITLDRKGGRGLRWLRKFLLVVSLAICWNHYKKCVGLVKAYDMNPVLHFPVYCFSIPALLVYAIWKTSRSSID